MNLDVLDSLLIDVILVLAVISNILIETQKIGEYYGEYKDRS